MDFTREPIIESVITPKDGCKLVVRSSKAASQEEFFVDSVEVVSFGHSLYFRSLERPKSFFVPAGDYEILEVREARLVLKNVGLDRSTIKIGGGREVKKEKEEVPVAAPTEAAEARGDKKRDSKRRHSRRRRSKNDPLPSEETKEQEPEEVAEEEEVVEKPRPVRSGLLPPPSTLISETIARYKDNALFKDAFFLKDEDEVEGESDDFTLEESPVEEEAEEHFPTVLTSGSDFGSFEMTEEEEEEIYRQRQKYQENEDDDHIPPKVNDDLIGESSEIESTNQ